MCRDIDGAKKSRARTGKAACPVQVPGAGRLPVCQRRSTRSAILLLTHEPMTVTSRPPGGLGRRFFCGTGRGSQVVQAVWWCSAAYCTAVVYV